MPISPELQQVYANGSPTVRVLETLELQHHTFSQSLRIVNDVQGWWLQIETNSTPVRFDAFPFSVVDPPQNSRGVQSLQLSIDNVDGSMIEKLEGTQDGLSVPIRLVYRVYLSNDNTGPQNDPPLTLEIRQISVDNFKVVATATNDNLQNKAFPNQSYDRVFNTLVANE